MILISTLHSCKRILLLSFLILLSSATLVAQVTIREKIIIDPKTAQHTSPKVKPHDQLQSITDTNGTIVTVKYYYRACEGFGIVRTVLSPCSNAYTDSSIGNTVHDVNEQGCAILRFNVYDEGSYIFRGDRQFSCPQSFPFSYPPCFLLDCSNDSIVVTDNRNNTFRSVPSSRPTVNYTSPVGTECIVNNPQSQKFDTSSVEILHEGDSFTWIDNNEPRTVLVGDVCGLANVSQGDVLVGFEQMLTQIPINLQQSSVPIYYPGLSGIDIAPCKDGVNNKWYFNVRNLRVPIFQSICDSIIRANGLIDLGDGTNYPLLSQIIFNCPDWYDLRKWIEYVRDRAHDSTVAQPSNRVMRFSKYYFSSAILIHEAQHGRDQLDSLRTSIDSAYTEIYGKAVSTLEYPCAKNALGAKYEILNILSRSYTNGASKPIDLANARRAAKPVYDQIIDNIKTWVKTHIVPPCHR